MKHLYAWIVGLMLIPAISNAQSFTSMDELLEDDYNSGGTVGVVDMNNDGYDDIVTLDNSTDLKILYQTPNGFVEVAYGTVSGAQQWGYSVGDLKNDGHKDVIVGGNSDGVHYVAIDEMGTSGMTDLPNSIIFTQDCSMADMDHDGDLDFFGCHDVGLSRIWENDGNGVMTNSDVIDLTDYDPGFFPDTDHSGNYGTVWSDFDDDGDVDLYIAKCRQGVGEIFDPRRINQLWINDGNGNYTEGAEDRGLVIYKQSWTADFADYDNDGDFDCLITNHDSYLTLLENDGSGYFTDVSAEAGLDDIFGFFLQAKMADFDNDGYKDILFAGGIHSYLKNMGDGTFEEQANMFPYGNTMHSFGVGDLNKDGFLDVYASYGDIYVDPDYSNPDKIWMNDTNANNWIAFDLQGIESNMDAVGAKIKIYGDWGVQVREVRAGESYGIVNTFHLHFGLGSATEIDSIEIQWPDGDTQVVEDYVINTYNPVFETGCSIAVEVSAAGETTICPGETVTINAPMGYTYMWSNGETAQSIEVSDAGYYNVVVTDGNCYGQSNSIAVTVTQPEYPTLTVNGDVIFCEGGSVELISSSADSYDWSNGESGQAVTITEAGTYSVSVPGECAADLQSEEIVVEVFESPATPVVEDAEVISPNTVVLSGDGSEVELHWYENEMDSDPVFVGNSFETPGITESTSYWVEDVITYGGVQGIGGEPSNDLQNGDYFNNEGRYMIFDANEDIILSSIRVFADAAGSRTIGVVDQFGTVLAQGDFDIPAGESVVELDFFVPEGDNHSLRSLSANPGLWRDGPPADLNYPYDLNGLATITTSSVNGENALNYYYFFYDWVVETPSYQCVSDRVEVNIIVTSVEEIDGLESLSVYPNPASDNLTLSFELSAPKSMEATLLDVTGRIVENRVLATQVGANNAVFNVKDLAPGIYHMQLNLDSERITTKVIVK